MLLKGNKNIHFIKPMQPRSCAILHLITTLDIGGAEISLLNLLSSFSKKKFSMHVVSLTDLGPIGLKIQALGIPVCTLNMPHGKLTLGGIVRLRKILITTKPMILQSWLYHADLLGLLGGRLTGVKYIFWNIRSSGLEVDTYKFTTTLTIRICALLSFLPNAIIINSQRAKINHSKYGYRAKLLKIIPNGIDSNKFRPNHKSKIRLRRELGITESDPILIGLIARYDPVKGHHTFIRSALRILKSRQDVYFIMAGKGVEWTNKELVGKIPPEHKKNFHFLGQRNDVDQITAALDVATLCSYGEGFPNIVAEAMACGVPCVVTDVGDAAFIVGNTGKVVTPGDPIALVSAWKELMNLDKQRMNELGLAARKRIVEHFELSKMVKRYEAFYNLFITE